MIDRPKRLLPIVITLSFNQDISAFSNFDWDVNGIFQIPFIQVIFVSTWDFTWTYGYINLIDWLVTVMVNNLDYLDNRGFLLITANQSDNQYN